MKGGREGRLEGKRLAEGCSIFTVLGVFQANIRFPLQGTSRPAHYTVLYDSWNLSPDDWQVCLLHNLIC